MFGSDFKITFVKFSWLYLMFRSIYLLFRTNYNQLYLSIVVTITFIMFETNLKHIFFNVWFYTFKRIILPKLISNYWKHVSEFEFEPNKSDFNHFQITLIHTFQPYRSCALFHTKTLKINNSTSNKLFIEVFSDVIIHLVEIITVFFIWKLQYL